MDIDDTLCLHAPPSDPFRHCFSLVSTFRTEQLSGPFFLASPGQPRLRRGCRPSFREILMRSSHQEERAWWESEKVEWGFDLVTPRNVKIADVRGSDGKGWRQRLAARIRTGWGRPSRRVVYFHFAFFHKSIAKFQTVLVDLFLPRCLGDAVAKEENQWISAGRSSQPLPTMEFQSAFWHMIRVLSGDSCLGRVLRRAVKESRISAVASTSIILDRSRSPRKMARALN